MDICSDVSIDVHGDVLWMFVGNWFRHSNVKTGFVQNGFVVEKQNDENKENSSRTWLVSAADSDDDVEVDKCSSIVVESSVVQNVEQMEVQEEVQKVPPITTNATKGQHMTDDLAAGVQSVDQSTGQVVMVCH